MTTLKFYSPRLISSADTFLLKKFAHMSRPGKTITSERLDTMDKIAHQILSVDSRSNLESCVKIDNFDLQLIYSKTCHQRPLSSATTSLVRPQFGCTNSFFYVLDLTSETTLSCGTKGHFFVATSAYRVPTTPGKMTTVFPVLEKYWNFIILLKILEKWE